MTNLDPTSAVAKPMRPHAVGAAEPAPRASDGGDGAAFRRLLEQLEAMAQPATAPVADAEDLRTALRRADDEFAAAMDLRRRLEDAVRRR